MPNENNPNQPTNNAESPNSENNNGVPNQAGNNAGGDNTPKKPSIEEVPEALRATVNSLLAAARKDGKESGKNEAKTQAERDAEAERQRNLEKNQEFEPLYQAEKTKREEAEKRATAAERDNLQLTIALEKKLPNPTLACKRLIGNTREELESDADSLLKVLKSDDAEEARKAAEANPPATSQGGDESQVVKETVDSQQNSYTAQRNLDIYNY